MNKTNTLLHIICFSFIAYLMLSCSKIDTGNPIEVSKAYVNGFNDRDLDEIRSISIEGKSEDELKNILEMWDNLESSIIIKSTTVTNQSEAETIISMILIYNMNVNGRNINEAESREFLLIKNNNEWKIKKGLL